MQIARFPHSPPPPTRRRVPTRSPDAGQTSPVSASRSLSGLPSKPAPQTRLALAEAHSAYRAALGAFRAAGRSDKEAAPKDGL